MAFWSEPTGTVFEEGYTDNRQSGRMPFRFPLRATIYPAAMDNAETSRVCHLLAHDLSGGGISLVSGVRLREGQRIELEMPDRVRCVVVRRVSSMNNGRYLVGCQFCDTDQAAPTA
jgi:PilZ domain